MNAPFRSQSALNCVVACRSCWLLAGDNEVMVWEPHSISIEEHSTARAAVAVLGILNGHINHLGVIRVASILISQSYDWQFLTSQLQNLTVVNYRVFIMVVTCWLQVVLALVRCR